MSKKECNPIEKLQEVMNKKAVKIYRECQIDTNTDSDNIENDCDPKDNEGVLEASDELKMITTDINIKDYMINYENLYSLSEIDPINLEAFSTLNKKERKEIISLMSFAYCNICPLIDLIGKLKREKVERKKELKIVCRILSELVSKGTSCSYLLKFIFDNKDKKYINTLSLHDLFKSMVFNRTSRNIKLKIIDCIEFIMKGDNYDKTLADIDVIGVFSLQEVLIILSKDLLKSLNPEIVDIVPESMELYMGLIDEWYYGINNNAIYKKILEHSSVSKSEYYKEEVLTIILERDSRIDKYINKINDTNIRFLNIVDKEQLRCMFSSDVLFNLIINIDYENNEDALLYKKFKLVLTNPNVIVRRDLSGIVNATTITEKTFTRVQNFIKRNYFRDMDNYLDFIINNEEMLSELENIIESLDVDCVQCDNPFVSYVAKRHSGVFMVFKNDTDTRLKSVISTILNCDYDPNVQTVIKKSNSTELNERMIILIAKDDTYKHVGKLLKTVDIVINKNYTDLEKYFNMLNDDNLSVADIKKFLIEGTK